MLEKRPLLDMRTPNAQLSMRTHAVCLWTLLQYSFILYADNTGPDPPALMRRLIRAFVVRQLHKGPFRALRISWFCHLLVLWPMV